MCAIYGFIGRGENRVRIETLVSIVKGNIARGPHAFGMSWIDPDGRLHCFKQRGRLTDHMGILRMAAGASVLIGHLRWATHGEPSNNINNHPHPADGGWIVHNGVIGNYRALLKEQQLPIVTECDSEVLGIMLEQGSDSLIDRCAAAINQTSGNLGLMGLWSRPTQLIVARRGNPLHMSDTREGIYFASLVGGLPGEPAALRDDTIRIYTRKSGKIHHRIINLADQEPDDVSLFGDRPTHATHATQATHVTQFARATRPRDGVTRIGGRWLNSKGQVCGD